jgi:malonyl-CoA/methylmalonyl-CoA synthetase
VPIRHDQLRAQVETLVAAWEWSADDRILEILPLHHVHGIVNILCCALWSGASCRFLPKFDPEKVWQAIAAYEPTLLMAVPTLYQRLIDTFERQGAETQKEWSAAARQLRLMVSGSAPLPITVFARWQEISGHDLLERYGMTEIGMALSNPLHGPRRPGTVGRPLPGVLARIVDAQGQEIEPGQPGELEVAGPSVFRGYWQRPEADRDAFRAGFFRTGDIAIVETDGYFRLLGRSSVDILKTGGEKVSALEIEMVLRDHPAIADLAVIGLPDPDWGQRVAAAIEAKGGVKLELEELRAWARSRLATYKLPSRLVVVEQLPRNALGKVVKAEVAKLFE